MPYTIEDVKGCIDHMPNILEGLFQKYGKDRIYGRFLTDDLAEPRASMEFLCLSLEQQGTDFHFLFCDDHHKFDERQYPGPHPTDDEIKRGLKLLYEGWMEIKNTNDGNVKNFLLGRWIGQKNFGRTLLKKIRERSDLPKLQEIFVRYERGRVIDSKGKEKRAIKGVKSLKLLRAIMRNSYVLEKVGGFRKLLMDESEDYLKNKIGLREYDVHKTFPKFNDINDDYFKPKNYIRFLEKRIRERKLENGYPEIYGEHGDKSKKDEKAFVEVGPDTMSYVLRDMAKHHGDQILRGTEYCYKVDSNANGFIRKTGLVLSARFPKDVDPMTVIYERGLHEGLMEEMCLREPKFTYASLNERFYKHHINYCQEYYSKKTSSEPECRLSRYCYSFREKMCDGGCER